MFDAYYLCLMVGLDSVRLSSPDEVETEEFTKSYPVSFQRQADIIAGLLIDAELVRNGIETEDRASIEREMLELLDSHSPTRLSEKGNDLLNRYAASGFRLLREKHPDPPQSLEEFLVCYSDVWDSLPVG
jgi:hypothetical protein